MGGIKFENSQQIYFEHNLERQVKNESILELD